MSSFLISAKYDATCSSGFIEGHSLSLLSAREQLGLKQWYFEVGHTQHNVQGPKDRINLESTGQKY